MGFDKAWLQYGDAPQWQVVTRLLEQVCERVLVSIREAQRQPYGVEVIPDTMEAGPAGRSVCVSAESGCCLAGSRGRYAFLTEKSLEYLVSQRDTGCAATAFSRQTAFRSFGYYF